MASLPACHSPLAAVACSDECHHRAPQHTPPQPAALQGAAVGTSLQGSTGQHPAWKHLDTPRIRMAALRLAAPGLTLLELCRPAQQHLQALHTPQLHCCHKHPCLITQPNMHPGCTFTHSCFLSLQDSLPRTMGSSDRRAAAGEAASRARLARSTWLSPAGRLPMTAWVMKLLRKLLGCRHTAGTSGGSRVAGRGQAGLQAVLI